MVKILYTGGHMPKGVYEVKEEKAEQLLKLADWTEAGEQPKIAVKEPKGKKK